MSNYRGIQYKGLEFTTKEVNMNFRIKVSGVSDGKKLHTLLGVSGLQQVIADDKLTNEILRKAFNSDKCIYTRKLRRGLILTLYSK